MTISHTHRTLNDYRICPEPLHDERHELIQKIVSRLFFVAMVAGIVGIIISLRQPSSDNTPTPPMSEPVAQPAPEPAVEQNSSPVTPDANAVTTEPSSTLTAPAPVAARPTSKPRDVKPSAAQAPAAAVSTSSTAVNEPVLNDPVDDPATTTTSTPENNPAIKEE
jgi:cytoskeletal protein RodZ